MLSYVQNNYVEKVDERQLVYGAIRGMLETLDPHTVFMPPELFKEMKIDTSGEFGGLGLDVVRRGDALVVVSPLDDTPAARAGIQPGRRDPRHRRREHAGDGRGARHRRGCAVRQGSG